MTTEERDRLYAPGCLLCRDAGMVIVPHPKCVDTRAGKCVGFEGGPTVRTVAVACACPLGLKVAGLLTWDRYTRSVNGLDGPELLREWEEDRDIRERLAAAA